jgi:hypothetical protein
MPIDLGHISLAYLPRKMTLDEISTIVTVVLGNVRITAFRCGRQ